MGSTPTLVSRFFDQVKLESDYIFAIMTYGNTSLGALDHIKRTAGKNGIALSYLNKVLMVDSSIKYFDMAQQIRDQGKKQIDNQIKEISAHITSRKKHIAASGFFMGQVSRLTHRLYKKEIGDVDRKYDVEPHCKNCGICAQVCPVNNIRMEKGPVFNHNCIRCYACTHNCPQNAIRFQGEKSKARFRNDQVRLKEIIQSNHVDKLEI